MYLVNSSQISVYVWVIVHYNYISSILCFLFKIDHVLLLLLLLLVMCVLNPNVNMQPIPVKCPLPLHTAHWTAKHLVADEDMLRNPGGFRSGAKTLYSRARLLQTIQIRVYLGTV